MSCGAEHFYREIKTHGCIWSTCNGCGWRLCNHWPSCPRCAILQVEALQKVAEIARAHQCARKRYEVEGKPLTRCELCEALEGVDKRVGVSIHDAKPCPTCGKLIGEQCPECSVKKEGNDGL